MTSLTAVSCLIQILLFFCYNAMSISESYYAPPDPLENSMVSQLHHGNRRSGSIISEEQDQCSCFPRRSVSPSLEEQLDPYNFGLQRLVVYMYLNIASEQAYVYIPNRKKQLVFPSLNFELDDDLQPLADKGILEKNTNISILINNTSSKPNLRDTDDTTGSKWSIDSTASINNSPNGLPSNSLRQSPNHNKRENSQLMDPLNANNYKQIQGLNSPMDYPNLSQTSNMNAPLNPDLNIPRNNWEDRKSVNYNERSEETVEKSPLDYYDSEYEMPPIFREAIKPEKNPKPSTIGFNQVPYIVSQTPEPNLNLSKIVPDKNNIVHFIPNNEPVKSILQPYDSILPKKSGGVNMIRLPVKLNFIQVPSNRPKILKSDQSTSDNIEVEPNMINVHSNNHGRIPDKLDTYSYMTKAALNPSNEGRSSDNLKDKPHVSKDPRNQLQSLRVGNLFSDWFYSQIAKANQGIDIQINNDTLKKDIIQTLARNNLYISQDGYLIDRHGNVISWDYLQLRAILVGEPMAYETVINSPDPINLEPSNTYWKALLTTFESPLETVILDIIPLGKMQLLGKSSAKVNVTIDSHICKSGDCKIIVPVRVGDREMLAKLQNYMQIRPQQLNIPDKSFYRRNLGLKLEPRKKPTLQIYDKYKEQGTSKSRKTLTKSDRSEKDPVNNVSGRTTTAVPSTSVATVAPDTEGKNDKDVVDWRIIGGAAATSSGAPLSVRGRSGYIF